MEDIIKNCVESRKNAIMAAYKGDNQELLDEINSYFERLEEYAKGFESITDFESKFAISSLASEYTNLFTKVMTQGEEPEKEESLASEVGKEVADDVYRYGRRKARQEAYDKVRDIPVVGEALTAKQHFDFFSRFRKKKDD